MNWKSPVYQAMDNYGNWNDDPNGASKFYDYSCEMPSGQKIERSARFFNDWAFTQALVRWNMNGNGMYKYAPIDSKAVNERPRED